MASKYENARAAGGPGASETVQLATADGLEGNTHPVFRPGWGAGRWPLATYDQLFEQRSTCSTCGATAIVQVELDSDLSCGTHTARPIGQCGAAGCCELVPQVDDRTVWQFATAPAGGSA